mmetsp:Transcript_113014/g.319725  ORF Transcript_113014/g.319725 Transcript_113014/m.319725 type:complete len:206 (-) Transcript_113014:472-1089(-)
MASEAARWRFFAGLSSPVVACGAILFLGGLNAYQRANHLQPMRDFVKNGTCKILQFRHWCTHKPSRCFVHVVFNPDSSIANLTFSDSDWSDKWASDHFPHVHVGDEVPCWYPRVCLLQSERNDYQCQNAECVQIQDPSHAVEYWRSEGRRMGNPGLVILVLSALAFLFSAAMSLWHTRLQRRYSDRRAVSDFADNSVGAESTNLE